MASKVVGILESIHSACRPILKKIEVNSFFGFSDLRIGSLIVAVIQLILVGASYYKNDWFLGTFYFIMAIVLIIGAALDQKYLAVPWLLITFLLECFLIGCMIVNVFGTQFEVFFMKFFSFFFHLIGFSVVYSYYMTAHELPTVNNPV